MEQTMNVYLAIDNSILLKGFEGLILDQFKNANLIAVSNPKELFEINFNSSDETQKILIYDSTIGFDQPNLYLHNLIQSYPHLRTLVLASEFNQKRIKFLFNAGICGVMSPDCTAEEFHEIFNAVLHGKTSLDHKFQEELIKHFCQKEGNFMQKTETSFEENYESNYVEELFGLTKREKEILCLVCNGMNTKEISEELFISLHTAETHRRNLLYKLDVKNTAQMVKLAVANRLVAV